MNFILLSGISLEMLLSKFCEIFFFDASFIDELDSSGVIFVILLSYLAHEFYLFVVLAFILYYLNNRFYTIPFIKFRG